MLPNSIAAFDEIAPLAGLLQTDSKTIAAEVNFLSSFIGNGGRVLDFGCGTGQMSIALAQRGFNVVGYEPSVGMRNQLKLSLASTPLGRHVRIVDRADLLLLERGFDLVFARSVFPHLIDEGERIDALLAMKKLVGLQGRIVFDIRIAQYLQAAMSELKLAREDEAGRIELFASRMRRPDGLFVTEWRVVSQDKFCLPISESRYTFLIRADGESYADELCNHCGVERLTFYSGYEMRAEASAGALLVVVAR